MAESKSTNPSSATARANADRLPPQNLEAEASLLGSLLLDKDAIIKVADLVSAADFYADKHGLIFGAILALFEKRDPIDLVTLTNYLEKHKQLKTIGGAAYITDLVNGVPSAAHVANYAQIVREQATLRNLLTASTRISDMVFSDPGALDHLLDNAEQTLFDVSQKHMKQNFTPIRDVLTESFDRLDSLHKDKQKIRGVSTGFKALDNLLAGFQPSDLIILAARPSMGKTSLALNIAQQVAIKLGIPVGIFSLEMSKEQLIDRLLAAEAGIDSWKLRTGNL